MQPRGRLTMAAVEYPTTGCKAKQAQIRAAYQQARMVGLRLREELAPSGTRYALFRIVEGRALLIGRRRNLTALRTLIERAGTVH